MPFQKKKVVIYLFFQKLNIDKHQCIYIKHLTEAPNFRFIPFLPYCLHLESPVGMKPFAKTQLKEGLSYLFFKILINLVLADVLCTFFINLLLYIDVSSFLPRSSKFAWGYNVLLLYSRIIPCM